MNDILEAFSQAFDLIATTDAALLEIVGLSLQVSLSAVFIACVIGFPLGASLAVGRFFGRRMLGVTVNALMGLPPVVVGLFVYMMLSRSGPFGVFGLLFTPTAMIIAQTILITPIVASLTAQVIEDLNREYDEMLRALHANRIQIIGTLLWDARWSLLTAALAGCGRALAEVGAVIIVGGNIDHVTRVMTTAIALETSKGNLALALALGLILIGIAFVITLVLRASQRRGLVQAHV